VNDAALAYARYGWMNNDERGRRSRIAAGIALSIAVHALLLSAYRGHQLPSREPAEPPRSIAVWLRPPPPPAVPQAARPEPRPQPQERRARQPRRVITVPPHAPTDSEQPFSVEQPPKPQPEPDRPRFDHDAALKMASKLANMPDPERAGTAVGQFQRKPYATESKAERAIAAAKRRDCKEGLPGGLLGPIIILFDKKDSGCKW
jgi:hypothetical protein